MKFEFNFTKDHLEQIVFKNKKVGEWYDSLAKVLPEYEITSIPRVAAFLAQTAHESGGFTATTENLNYSADGLNATFAKYFKNATPPVDANKYARQPEMIANRVYANRMGNGDEASGDGWKYRGRGLIQLTGKNNYSAMADSFDIPLDEITDYVSTPEGCVKSACWFWSTNKLNSYADAGDMKTITRKINGGENGMEDRMKYYDLALAVFGGKAPEQLRTLKLGDRGEDVARMQRALNIKADGDFGPGTEHAVMYFQRANGLTGDGIAGPATLTKIYGE